MDRKSAEACNIKLACTSVRMVNYTCSHRIEPYFLRRFLKVSTSMLYLGFSVDLFLTNLYYNVARAFVLPFSQMLITQRLKTNLKWANLRNTAKNMRSAKKCHTRKTLRSQNIPRRYQIEDKRKFNFSQTKIESVWALVEIQILLNCDIFGTCFDHLVHQKVVGMPQMFLPKIRFIVVYPKYFHKYLCQLNKTCEACFSSNSVNANLDLRLK